MKAWLFAHVEALPDGSFRQTIWITDNLKEPHKEEIGPIAVNALDDLVRAKKRRGRAVRHTLYIGACAALLASCTAEQVGAGTDRVAAACAAVMPLAQQAAMLPPYGPAVAAFALAACGSNAGIARLAADPTSAAWLDEQAAKLRAILHRSS